MTPQHEREATMMAIRQAGKRRWTRRQDGRLKPRPDWPKLEEPA